MVLNCSFFAESKVRAPTVSNCFPLNFQKKNGIARKTFFEKKKADWQFWHDHAGPLPTVSDCFRLFPTVSDCFSFSGTPVGPVDHWFNKNHNIQHFSSRPFCAQVAPNDAFWLWNPIYPKNPKTPRPRFRLFPTVSDCFRLFPTVSDCFRLFQFLWNASWACGPLIQQKSQHSTLFLTTLLRAGCSKWCILTLKPNIP